MIGFRGYAALFLLMILVPLTGVYVIRLGWYPVALVGSSVISARQLNETLESVRHYYQQAKVPPQYIPASETALRKDVLDKLIENAIVYRVLRARIGDNFGDLVEGRIDAARLRDPDFAQSVATLYGTTVERFKELVLIPQAQAEILRADVSHEQQNYEGFIRQLRRDARVVVLMNGFRWDGERVAER